MYRLKPNCWVCSFGPPTGLIPQNSRNIASGMLSNQEEEEEQPEDFPAACHHTMGRDKLR